MAAAEVTAGAKEKTPSDTTPLVPNRDSSLALPWTVWRILGTEFGERFSYYGLRAVLTLYFVSMGLSESEAVSYFAYTAAGAYLTAVFGGALADIYWGRFLTILVFSLVYVVGATALALHAGIGSGLAGALVCLALVAVGTGGIKPCVSSFGADQLAEGNEAARSRYFYSFYISINAGSMLSYMVVPLLRVQFGFGAAFGASAVVLGVAVAVFAAGRESYRRLPPSASFYSDLAAYAQRSLRQRFQGVSMTAPGAPAAQVVGAPTASAAHGNEKLEDGLDRSRAVDEAIAALWRLLPALLLLPFFWAAFDQQGSAFVLQAARMRRIGLLPFGWEITPEAVLIANPVFVLVLVPTLARLFEVWPDYTGRPAPPPLAKMGGGMLSAAAAFLWAASVQWRVDAAAPETVPILWQLPQFFLLTVGEVLVSVVALDYFYSEAPPEAKTAAAALQLLTVSAGNLLCGALYQGLASFLTHADFLILFATLLVCSGFALFWAASVTPRRLAAAE